MVVVTSCKGQAVICSDGVDLYRIMDENVNGMAVDLLQVLFGLDKIRGLASSPGLIIPAHDLLVLERFPSLIDGVAEIV